MAELGPLAARVQQSCIAQRSKSRGLVRFS